MTAMYYHLETRSWDAAKAFDRVVQNYLLGPDAARQDLMKLGVSIPTALPAPVDSPPQETGVVTVLSSEESLEDRTVVETETPQDPGVFSTFDVLFHESRQLARQHQPQVHQQLELLQEQRVMRQVAASAPLVDLSAV